MFDDVLFPEKYGDAAVGGPTFENLTSRTQAGTEGRKMLWERGRCRWALGFEALTQDDALELLTFFLARKGRLRGFRFKDPLDNSAANEPLDHGGLETVQLTKTYTSGSAEYVRTITKPVAGSVTLAKNGVPIASDRFTMDALLGTITLLDAIAPEDTLVWSGSFHIPARFDNDALLARAEALEIASIGATGIFLLDEVVLMELV